MKRSTIGLFLCILLTAGLAMSAESLSAQDFKPPKGHVNISNSNINEGHTGVVVFANKKGFIIVWADDHNIKMQFFTKNGRKVGSPRIIFQNTAHKIHAVTGAWTGKWGQVIWAQDTGTGVAIWGMVLNQRGVVQAAPSQPLTHGFGSSTRKFGLPCVSWNGKYAMVSFMETESPFSIYCGKFSQKLYRFGTFKKVKSGKYGTPTDIAANPHEKGWILSWTEQKADRTLDTGREVVSYQTASSIRKLANVMGKTKYNNMPNVLLARAWLGLLGITYWIGITRDGIANPYANLYHTFNLFGQWMFGKDSYEPITWLNLLDMRIFHIVLGVAGMVHWIHIWRSATAAFPMLWILHNVAGKWNAVNYGTCLCYIVYHVWYAYHQSRKHACFAYSGRGQERSEVSQVFAGWHPIVKY